MFKAVLLQFCTALLGCAIGAVFFGWRGGISAALGGLACVLPSLLFAIRLSAVSRQPGNPHVSAFFIGEAIKVALTLAILASITLVYPGAHWGAVVIGLIVTLQANFLAFLVKP
jgi:ATP synthase protein I